MQTQLEGRRPFTVVAVFSSKLGPAARFLHAHLVTVVRKTLHAASAGARVSPLYSAFVKLHSAYKKQTPLHDSIFTHAECSVVLLDLLRGRVFSLSYGENTHPPHVTSALGHAAFPTNSREHMLDGVVVEDAVYSQLIGDHHVVLGSPGLWCVISASTLDHHMRHTATTNCGDKRIATAQSYGAYHRTVLRVCAFRVSATPRTC